MAYPQDSFDSVWVHADTLVGRRRKVIQANTLFYQLDVLRKTGRYDAFKLKWHPTYDEAPVVWPIPNHLFWDSDVAKWIEGACYFLKQHHIPEIETAVKELVDMIQSAQQADGYLNIHYTVVEPGKRFTNLRDMHELYNAGHLIEAALAHEYVFGNGDLLGSIVRYVDLLCTKFGPGADQTHGYPGHPEIELALLRLYQQTGDTRHLNLARYFINERGNPIGSHGKNYFDDEAHMRQDDVNKRPAFYPEPRCLWYHQAHAPIVDQPSVEGHAVRAVYLLTAVADLIKTEGQAKQVDLTRALYRLWENMVGKKMYVTGGIGATKQWEGFNLDYFLPQGTEEGGCYSETCASIGLMMLAERLLQVELDASVTDVMELSFYNVVLTSMSHDGTRFTYDNQLASCNESPSKREDWFTVACCPPNVLRLFGHIGGYVWKYKDVGMAADITVHLYVSSTLKFSVNGSDVQISQQSRWPWDGDIQFKLEAASVPITLRLRIPLWASDFELMPACPNAELNNGYLTLPSEWISANPTFKLKIAFGTRWISQHPYSGNLVSLARGPIVYCAEDFDNTWVDDHFKSIMVDLKSPITEEVQRHEASGDEFIALKLLNGSTATNLAQISKQGPFLEATSVRKTLSSSSTIPELNFVPYYFRANRGGKGQMRVGLRQWER